MPVITRDPWDSSSAAGRGGAGCDVGAGEAGTGFAESAGHVFCRADKKRDVVLEGGGGGRLAGAGRAGRAGPGGPGRAESASSRWRSSVGGGGSAADANTVPAGTGRRHYTVRSGWPFLALEVYRTVRIGPGPAIAVH